MPFHGLLAPYPLWKTTPSLLPKKSSFQRLWSELKRRHVVRMAMVYAIVGWLVIQVANATFADFGIPVWTYRFVVLMAVLGFPISLVVAWAFELTPEGIKTSKTTREEHIGDLVDLGFRNTPIVGATTDRQAEQLCFARHSHDPICA
jgi:hypothetical protein